MSEKKCGDCKHRNTPQCAWQVKGGNSVDEPACAAFDDAPVIDWQARAEAAEGALAGMEDHASDLSKMYEEQKAESFANWKRYKAAEADADGLFHELARVQGLLDGEDFDLVQEVLDAHAAAVAGRK